MTDFTMSRRAVLAAFGVAAVAIALPTSGQAQAVNTDDGLAIKGYDPVAYFTKGAATKGDASYTASHEGATYHFASAENRDTFAANPDQYAPAYGGYCAFAVASGYTAPIDPEAFTVVDNRLYLNFNKRVRRRWERDIPGNIAKADANWPALAAK